MRIALLVAMIVIACSPVLADERPRSAVLAGRVLDKFSRAPIAGATVCIADNAGPVQTLKTDAAGAYRAVVAPGAYSIVFAVEGDRIGHRATATAGAMTRVGDRSHGARRTRTDRPLRARLRARSIV